MGDKPLISIIVPVYKVEQYIRECIESVITQSYREWEMILVDDGSPDRCPEICDEYSEIDSRIVVVHQKNGGLSEARNTGIRKSVGEYLYFLDSDDLLPEDALQTLVESGRKNDWPEYIKGCHYVLMPNNEKIITRNTPPRQFAVNQAIRSEVFMPGIILKHPLVWNGLIQRHMLCDNGIYFCKDGFPREDLLFHLELAGRSFRGIYCPIPTYTYRYGVAGSLSNSITKRNITNHISIINAILKSMSEINDAKVRVYAENELAGTVNSFFRNILRLDRSERKSLLKKYKQVINSDLIPSKNLSGFSKLYRNSYWCYSFLADIICVILPSKYKIFN